MTLPAGTISANASLSGNGNGGSISFTANGLAYFTGTGPVILNANAAGTGNGGSISLNWLTLFQRGYGQRSV